MAKDRKPWLVIWLDDSAQVVRSAKASYDTKEKAIEEAWRLAQSLDPSRNFVLVWDLALDEFVMSPFKRTR